MHQFYELLCVNALVTVQIQVTSWTVSANATFQVYKFSSEHISYRIRENFRLTKISPSPVTFVLQKYSVKVTTSSM